MPSLPSRRKTDRAIADAMHAVKATIKEANRVAGRLVAKGNYQAAEGLVALAKGADLFQAEISTLRSRWREVAYGKPAHTQGKVQRTPLWEYYKPILAALQALNGTATRQDLEKHLETSIPPILKSGDLQVNAHGKPRWKVMVRRARKSMIQEKFIEPGNGKKWVVTAAGRKALETPSPITKQ